MLKVKDKEKILKASRKKWLIAYKQTPKRLAATFSSETMEIREA